MRDRLKKLYHTLTKVAGLLGIDPAVAYAVIARGWGLLAGPVTILLITTRFSPELQGYYYTFNSIIGFNILFELGLSNVLIQFASHEWALLRLERDGTITGDSNALSRLASLTRLSLLWYLVMCSLLAVGLCAAGSIFFARSSQGAISWQGPWFTLCILSSLSLSATPLTAILTGCNHVKEISLFRVYQAIFFNAAIWIAILAGAELWTGPIASAVIILWTAAFLTAHYRKFYHQLLQPFNGEVISWREEILPFQWRMATSWLFGFLNTNLYIPVLFYYKGAVAAGQMGITWALINAVSEVSFNWVTTKIPQFGIYIAQKSYSALDSLYYRASRLSFFVLVAGNLLIAGGVWILNALHNPLAARFLPFLPTVLFLVVSTGNNIVGNMANYLRAHKKEPYLVTSILGGIASAIITFTLGSRYGAPGIAAGSLVLACLFFVPNVLIFLRCKAVWHRDAQSEKLPDQSIVPQGGAGTHGQSREPAGEEFLP
ncbi:MAG: hypothetical protein RDV48_01700 [Candidatus Eremiobacteraeota bacterium]|nr:hypothetical protein [Candidatus Eremiobacteraeota bacterium]